MRASLKHLFIVAVIGFFPLAVMGRVQQRDFLRRAVSLYYTSVIILIIFLCLLAFYTYDRGGNFIKATGTFY